jgi:hypothetical protein
MPVSKSNKKIGFIKQEATEQYYKYTTASAIRTKRAFRSVE